VNLELRLKLRPFKAGQDGLNAKPGKNLIPKAG
jgi:hypothetical protein